MNKLATFLFAALAACAYGQDTNYAQRIACEMQTPVGEDEPRLDTLTWLQGTTPLVVVEPTKRGRPIPYDASTSVRMIVGPSATGTLYAVRTNAAAVTNGYAIQWPTIWTNSSTNAWFYTVLFDKAGQTYWTGSGDLYITETTSTASNGLEWIEFTIPSVDWANIVGNPASSTSLVAYVATHVDASFLPLSGGTLSGNLSMANISAGPGYSRSIDFNNGMYTNSMFAYGGEMWISTGGGSPLKRIFYWNDLASLTSDVVVASSARLKKTVGEEDKDYPVAIVAGSTTNYADENGLIDIGEIGSGTGSGFPLTNNGDLAQFSLTNGLTVQATNGVFGALTAGTLSGASASIGSGTVAGNWNILGNLSVIGYASNVTWTYVDYRTNIMGGTTTTYVDKVVYTTNVQYLYTTYYTSTVNTITNWVDTFVNVGGTWNASNAAWVSIPNLYLAGTNATAGGQWDFTGATLLGVTQEEADPVFTNWLAGYVPPVTTEEDPIAIKPSQIGVGLLWTGSNLTATGEGTAIVTNEVDPRRYDAFREYATIDASSGTGTISATSALWLSLPASDQPRTLAMGTGFDAAQAWRFYVKVGRGTNTFSIDTNLVGYAFLSLPVSSTNHLLIDRFPGDASFRVWQVYR